MADPEQCVDLARYDTRVVTATGSRWIAWTNLRKVAGGFEMIADGADVTQQYYDPACLVMQGWAYAIEMEDHYE